MTDEKPWWQSKTVWGGAVAVLASVAAIFGKVIDPAAQASAVEALVQIAVACGGLVAILGRLSAGTKIK